MAQDALTLRDIEELEQLHRDGSLEALQRGYSMLRNDSNELLDMEQLVRLDETKCTPWVHWLCARPRHDRGRTRLAADLRA